MHRAWILAASIAVAMLSGCDDPQLPASCGELPEKDACPASGGGTCSDRSCSAVYGCTDGKWSLITRCDPSDAGIASTVDATDDAMDGPTSCDTTAPPPSDPDCTPLEAPECDFAIVQSCPASACTTGCTIFLRCAPGGWAAKAGAYCDDEGQLVVNP